jgi:hypothetical protein
MQAAKMEAIHETDDEISRRTPNEAFGRVIGATDNWVRGRKHGTGQCRSLLPIRFVSRRVHRKARRGAAAAAGRASRGDPRRRRRRCWSPAWNTDESWRPRQSSRQALIALTIRVQRRSETDALHVSGFAPGITPPSATVSSAATSRTIFPSSGTRSSVTREVMPETEIAASGSLQSL